MKQPHKIFLKRKGYRKRNDNVPTKIMSPSPDKMLQAKVNNLSGQIENENENKLAKIKPFKDWKKIGPFFNQVVLIFKNAQFTNFKSSFIKLKKVFLRVETVYTLSKAIFSVFILITIFFNIYLSFFDTYFFIKKWNVVFAKNSLLDKEDTLKFINILENNRQFSIFPSTQYWYLTDTNLTILGKNEFPEIEKVSIKKRIFPNGVEIEITTAPILLTLSVSIEGKSRQNWRVGQDGGIVGLDNMNLNTELVNVDKIISFDKPDFNLKSSKLYVQDLAQLDKLYFIATVWDLLKLIGINYNYTSVTSMNSADFDVKVQLPSGSFIWLDASKFDRNTIQKRILSVFSTNLKNQLISGSVKYVDLRIAKKVFVCPANLECAKAEKTN